ncbi:MAG: HAD-IIIA family hydrolase [Phycisphaera sp.]|nr:HAD-IIIA family hydrolase [Phycisphaera sp.]
MVSATAVKLICLDVDGVLTDGSIIVNDLGQETKRFFVRDGFAIRAAMSMGIQVGVITGRSSRCVNHRLEELGVSLVMQGQHDKRIALETLCQRAGVDLSQSAYLGDDLIDLPALMRCGYPMAVADAVEEVREVAKYVTQAPGGRGAVREAVDHILKQQGRWDELLERYGV